MSANNGLITAPVTTTDVGSTIGSSSRNVGVLCTSSQINKWSKHKPVNYPKTTGLVESEWKGTTADNGKGIFYGLQIGATATSWSTLHTSNYAYVGRPTGGSTSPYRLGDFRGYDHNAVPNLTGGLSADYYYWDVNGSLVLTINYDWAGNNTTGIDLNDLTAINSSGSITSWYPCIMVGNYVHALYNLTLSGTTSETARSYTPMYYNNTQYTRFSVDFDISALQVEQMQTVSFFMAKTINDSLIDLREWTNISNLAESSYIIGIPNCIGLQLESRRYNNIWTAIVTSVTARVGTGLTFSWRWQDTSDLPTSAQTLTLLVSQVGGVNAGSKQATWNVGGGTTGSISMTWAEAGMLAFQGMQLNLQVELNTSSGGHWEGTFNVTVTI